MMKAGLRSLLTVLTISLLICVGAKTNVANATALDDPASRGSGTAASGSGGLTPVVPEIDAGQITIGASAQVVMRLRNDSGKEIKISKIDLYPSSTVSANVSLDECSSGPLAGGTECAIVVNVKGIKSGNWRIEALIRHDARTKITTAAMKGTVEEGSTSTDKLLSDVEAIPDEIDFESVESGKPSTQSVVLRNVTSDPLEITDISVSPDNSGYTLKSECKKLDPGAACAVEITWSPTIKGSAKGVLFVKHTGATKVLTVDITGQYDPATVEKAKIFPEAVAGKGLLISSQEEIDFGTINDEASVTVALVNVGDTDMTLDSINLGGVENGLSVGNTGCRKGLTLKPVEACPLTLTWSAVRTGSIIDDVQIHHDGARGVLVLPVRGTANSTFNRDTKAVVVESSTPSATPVAPPKAEDKSQALEGFVITSHSNKRAIINGPGGSRVVSQGQQLTLGGIQWSVDITQQGVDFTSGKDRIRLLFDRSLSSVNRTTSQSGSSSGGSSGSSASATAAPAASSSN